VRQIWRLGSRNNAATLAHEIAGSALARNTFILLRQAIGDPRITA
jgi:hypothetical protein